MSLFLALLFYSIGLHASFGVNGIFAHMALEYNLRPSIMIPLELFFLLRIALSIQGCIISFMAFTKYSTKSM